MRVVVPLGNVVITRNALDVLDQGSVLEALRRHTRCDWGELCLEDIAVNNRALEEGNRLLSAYQDSRQVKFWIITEWDRSATTILLPEDY